ncbi:MAG: CRISPR-associated endonuclease Cas2 [Chloroflexi bacterium]|nr:MAG: CRISPR-associated endonuclease Cas2 [Chloroflexota bacterium]RLC84259.1 MAG: CRISPR-associated endonuclease Cas2 [Chloroflexota bacterium]
MNRKRFRHVITYDIPSDKRRTRIARALEGHGERVQYSVFECQLTRKQFDALWKELGELLEPQEDSLRAYRLCPACAGWAKTLGQAVLIKEVPQVFIA